VTGDKRKAMAINRMVSDLAAFAWTLSHREVERLADALRVLTERDKPGRASAPPLDNVIHFRK